MRLDNIKRFIPVFAILFVLIIIVLIYSIFSSSNKPSTEFQGEPVKTKTIPPREDVQKLPQETKSIRGKIIESQIDEIGGDIILYKDDSMDIKYIPTPDIFFVSIHKEPVNEAKIKAQGWFLNFGLEQTELCTLPVRFLLDFELKKTNPNFNPLPSGCSL